MQDLIENPSIVSSHPKKIHPYLLFALVSFLLAILSILLFFPALSYLYPAYSYDATSIDTNFFIYVARIMTEGKKPYLDIEDQKGILTFLTFYIGTKMGGRFGIFFLHVLLDFGVYFTSFLAVYQIRKNYWDIVNCGSIIFLLEAITGFGTTVSYETAFIIGIAFNLYLSALQKDSKKLFLIGSFVGGIQIGLAFQSRPTDGFVSLSLYIFYFVYFLRHKTGLQLLYNALAALFGFALTVGVFFLYCYSQGYLKEMIQIEYINGLRYSGFSSWVVFVLRPVLALYLFGIVLVYRHMYKIGYNKEMTLFFLVMNLSSILLEILMARFVHYLQSYLVLLSFSLTYAISSYPLPKKKKLVQIGGPSFLSTVGAIVGCFYLVYYYAIPNTTFSKHVNDTLKEEIRKAIPDVDHAKEDELYLVDVNAALLNEFHIQSTARFQTYQYNYLSFNPNLEGEIEGFVQEKKPAYILFEDKINLIEENQDAQEYLKTLKKALEDNYTEITSEKLKDTLPTFHIYQRNQA